MKTILFLLLFGFITPAFISAQVEKSVKVVGVDQSTMSQLENKNIPGGDYKSFELKPGETCQACIDACLNDPNCKAYTYVKPGVQRQNAVCWLKTSVSNPVVDQNCISGVKTIVNKQPVQVVNIDKIPISQVEDIINQPMQLVEVDEQTISQVENQNIPGGDYKSFELNPRETCKVCINACLNDPNCKAYTYVKPGVQRQNAVCWLKLSVSNPVVDPNCISGVKTTIKEQPVMEKSAKEIIEKQVEVKGMAKSAKEMILSQWEKIWGPTDFAVVDGESGAIYAKPSPEGSLLQGIYRWEGEPNIWTPLGMQQAKKCVASGWKPKNTIYCLTEEGVVYKYKGVPNSWESLGGPSGGKAGDIFGGQDQLLATATGNSPDIFRWDDLTNSWVRIGGYGKTFVVGRSSDPEFKMQVYRQSPDNAPQSTNGIYQWSGDWYKRGGPAGNIYITRSTLFATNPQSGDILSLYPDGWKRIGGPGNMFATDHKGHLFGLSPDKKGVYHWTGIPNNWEKIGDAAEKIFAGWDRLLFATSPDTKDLYCYRPKCPPIINIPNFASTIFTEKMKPITGKKNLLVILWDPQRPDHQAPSKQDIDQLLFGTTNSLKDWFKQNSGGKLEIVNAGVLGWYKADKESKHYWEELKTNDLYDKDGDGFLEGHIEKYTEAIKKAEKEFNFAAYDSDKDGKLTSNELGIFIIIPQNNAAGFGRGTAGKQYPTYEPLKVQGVEIPWIVEWYAGNPPDFGVAAHELGHLMLGSPDMYFAGFWPYAAGIYSIMDAAIGTTHLDPAEKLKLGWLNWKMATQSGVYTLKDIETHNEALILYHPQRGTDEYFIIENRWRGSSYDAGIPNVGEGIPLDGIGIWHIIENPNVFNDVNPFPQTGVLGEWGRLGIRLIRANYGTWDDTNALFHKKGAIVSDLTRPAQLLWLDGSPSGFRIKLLSDPGPEVQLEVTISCR